MAEMNRNLESAVCLDESYLRFVEALKDSSSKIQRDAEESAAFLLDDPSQETISLILCLCEKMNHLIEDSQERVKDHLRKAQSALSAYKTLL